MYATGYFHGLVSRCIGKYIVFIRTYPLPLNSTLILIMQFFVTHNDCKALWGISRLVKRFPVLWLQNASHENMVTTIITTITLKCSHEKITNQNNV